MQGRAARRPSVIITKGHRVDLLGNPIPTKQLRVDIVETIRETRAWLWGRVRNVC